MKVLIVTQYFWPEEFRVNDLAIDIIKRGHEVTVLTGNPNYPIGSFYRGYGLNYSVEYYHGIKVYRMPIIPRGRNGFQLVLNYISFVITGSIFAFFHKPKYDKIFALNFSPITAVYPAIVFKRRSKTELIIWVQDLWPESVTAAGKIKSKFLMKMLTKMVQHIYRNSDKVLVQSEAFIDSVMEKGVTASKISYLPNWAEDLYGNSIDVSKEKYQSLFPAGFIVMFAGNIGEAQDFDSIIKAIEITKQYPEIKWIILGDGRKKSWVETEILRLELQNTVFMLGRYPVVEMPDFFVHADIMLLSLKNEVIFSMTIPTKIQSYMAFGKPVVGMLNGIGAKVIEDADCGYTSNAADYSSLARNIIMAYHQERNLLQQKGENGRKYYNKHFSKELIINNLIELLKE